MPEEHVNGSKRLSICPAAVALTGPRGLSKASPGRQQAWRAAAEQVHGRDQHGAGMGLLVGFGILCVRFRQKRELICRAAGGAEECEKALSKALCTSWLLSWQQLAHW